MKGNSVDIISLLFANWKSGWCYTMVFLVLVIAWFRVQIKINLTTGN